MAKKNQEQSATSSVVQNWAEQNKQRLTEISNENPALYSGIVQALNYLSGRLGGGSVQQTEKSEIIEKPVLAEVPIVRTKEMFENTFIRIYDFPQFLQIQKAIMEIGYEYHPQRLPKNWKPTKKQPKFSIQNTSDLLHFINLRNLKITDDFICALMFIKSTDGVFQISTIFEQEEQEIILRTHQREINVVDLGLPPTLIDSMSMNLTKIWLRGFDVLHKTFQEFVFQKGIEFPSGKNIKLLFSDEQRGYRIEDDIIYPLSKFDWFFLKDETSISLRQFNISIPWVLDYFVNTKCAILNKNRDLPQLVDFFKNLKSLTGEAAKVNVDKDVLNDSYCFVTINENAEVYFMKWSSVSYDDIKRKEFQIGDLALPLIEAKKIEQQAFPKLYEKVQLPITIRGNTMTQSSVYYAKIIQQAEDFGVDWAYVVDNSEKWLSDNSTKYKVSVFTKASSKFIDEKIAENKLDVVLETFNKASEEALGFELDDLKPYISSEEVEIGMNIPAESEKNVSLEDQKPIQTDDTQDLEDELDNLEI